MGLRPWFIITGEAIFLDFLGGKNANAWHETGISKKSKHTFAGARCGIGSRLVQTRALQHARSSATPKATIRHSTHARIRSSNRNTHTGVRVSEPILRPLDVVLQRCSRRSRHSHSCGEGHSFFLSHDSSKPTKISDAHCHPEWPTLAETSKSQICCWVSRNSHTKWTQLSSSSSAMNYDSQKKPKIVSNLHSHPEWLTLAETSKWKICCWVSQNFQINWNKPTSSSATNLFL